MEKAILSIPLFMVMLLPAVPVGAYDQDDVEMDIFLQQKRSHLQDLQSRNVIAEEIAREQEEARVREQEEALADSANNRNTDSSDELEAMLQVYIDTLELYRPEEVVVVYQPVVSSPSSGGAPISRTSTARVEPAITLGCSSNSQTYTFRTVEERDRFQCPPEPAPSAGEPPPPPGPAPQRVPTCYSPNGVSYFASLGSCNNAQ